MEDLPTYLFGNPPMYGVKQQTSSYPQGVDLYIPLDFSNAPITNFTGYTITMLLKDSQDTDDAIWTGDSTSAISLINGTYYAYIPLTFTSTLPAGLYYATIFATKNDSSSSITAPEQVILQYQLISISNIIDLDGVGQTEIIGSNLQIDGNITFSSGNTRYKVGLGWQFYNATTGLWHTKVCVGNPPQDGWDTGEL